MIPTVNTDIMWTGILEVLFDSAVLSKHGTTTIHTCKYNSWYINIFLIIEVLNCLKKVFCIAPFKLQKIQKMIFYFSIANNLSDPGQHEATAYICRLSNDNYNYCFISHPITNNCHKHRNYVSKKISDVSGYFRKLQVFFQYILLKFNDRKLNKLFTVCCIRLMLLFKKFSNFD